MKRAALFLGLVCIGALALQADIASGQGGGSVVGWGAKVIGEEDVIGDLVAISAGSSHSLGLTSNGRIVAFGRITYGQCNVPEPNADFVAIAANDQYSLGLKSNGAIVYMGSCYYNLCVIPAPNTDYVAIAAGFYHALALRSDSSVVAWGYGSNGQCNVPTPNTGFVAVAGGYYHSLGLKSDGTIATWGSTYPPSPNTDFVAIAAGMYHSLGLKSDGSIVAWGQDTYGQCTVPSPNADFVAIAAGSYHSLGLKSDGSIVAWGQDTYGQCTVPAPNSGFSAIAGGAHHSLAIASDGGLLAWGEDNYGQCNAPISGVPNTDFLAIAAGGETASQAHTLGLKSDGTIAAWGYNGYGQCAVPSPNADFVAIAAGSYHSLGLKSDGALAAWGSNSYGQCTLPEPNSSFAKIAAGDNFSLGLKFDATIEAWGNNSYGQCTVPEPNAGFIAVAAGHGHGLGLKSDGSIVAWGQNNYNQCVIPSPNAGFVAIAAGWYHSLGLKGDGTIVVWGDNTYGQHSVPSPNSGFASLAGGSYHCLGLKSDGTIVAWGQNTYGECTVPLPNASFGAVAAADGYSLALRVSNQPPAVTVDEGVLNVSEGALACNSGAVSDPDGDVVVLDASVGTVVNNGDGTWSWNLLAADGPAVGQTITITGNDGKGGRAVATFELTVANIAPIMSSVEVPLDPIGLSEQPIRGSATFTDPAGAADEPFACTFDYGDGSGPVAGTVDGTTCTGPDHSYTCAGVYTVAATVADKDDGVGSATATTYLVIYDPSAGCVTGGGWIDSPPGAYPAHPDLGGRANFGFVSKYKRGQSQPDGDTEFQFHAGDLNFHSTSYDWLVIAGPHAKYKGSGEINGAGDYAFMLTATDAEVHGGGDTDLFRIKIWEKNADETVVYDNKIGEGDDSYAGTALGGGQIKIHSGGAAKQRPDPGDDPDVATAVVIPAAYALLASVPNPFNPTTNIRFDLPEAAAVRLVLYDTMGRAVARLIDGAMPAGEHRVTFDGSGLPSGRYFYRLDAGSFTATRSMTLTK